MGEVVAAKAPRRRTIGLTGGIATGKSTVSDYLVRQYGLPVLDADVFAREAVAAGSETLEVICDRYGSAVLLPDGSLNRPQLGKIIFSNMAEKEWLEQQIHPYVRRRFREESDALEANQILIYSIPLLFEANLTHLVTEIWVVTCSPVQQLERLMQRNNLSGQEAQARIDAQMNLDEKVRRANVVLDNSHSQSALFSQIDQLMR